jgi:hypothetical protein
MAEVHLHFPTYLGQERIYVCLLPTSWWFLALSNLQTWRCRQTFPPKRPLTFNGLQGVISQKIEVFVTTAVKTSDHTNMSERLIVYLSNFIFFSLFFLCFIYLSFFFASLCLQFCLDVSLSIFYVLFLCIQIFFRFIFLFSCLFRSLHVCPFILPFLKSLRVRLIYSQ